MHRSFGFSVEILENMGSSNSRPATLDEERRRRQDQQQREQAEQKRKQDEKEIACKELEYKHEQETQKIKNAEMGDERKDNLQAKKLDLEHERLAKGQEKVLSIVEEAFRRAPVTSMNEVAYAGYILQCIQSSQPVEMNVLTLVASKVNNPPPLNLEELVDQTVKRTIQEENDLESEEDGFPYQVPPLARSTVMAKEHD